MKQSQIRPKNVALGLPSQNQGLYQKVQIHPCKGEKFYACFELNKNVYEQIKKYINGDILITISGDACSTGLTLADCVQKYMTEELIFKVYTFDEIIEKLQWNKQMIKELAFDDQTKSKIILRRKQMKSNLISQVKELTIESKIIPNDIGDSSQQNRLAYISRMIKAHQAELQKLSSINKNIIENRNSVQSAVYSVLSFCHFCQLPINHDAVQTNCKHHYHVSCLDNIIQAQLAQKQPVIKCLCNMNQKIQLFNHLEDEFAIQNYRQQLLVIQLFHIKQANMSRIKVCPNRSCQYFYIQEKPQTGPNFCPSCLQNIPQNR